MSKKPDGGPAFPSELVKDNAAGMPRGMSLRDWFAGKAIASMCLPANLVWTTPKDAEVWAKSAYLYADAMIAERDKDE